MGYITNGVYRKQYKTKQNDTFDKIAYELYGDEKVASFIIKENSEHADTLIFNEGVYLYLPVVERIVKNTLPTWKEGS